MRKLYLKLLSMMLIILILTGCTKPEPVTLEQIYPGKLLKVSKIEIRHGNGELREITDKSVINPWIDSVKDIVFEPSTNQDGKVGYLYNVMLFEGVELKLSFSTTQINDVYYKENVQILEKLHLLYNEKDSSKYENVREDVWNYIEVEGLDKKRNFNKEKWERATVVKVNLKDRYKEYINKNYDGKEIFLVSLVHKDVIASPTFLVDQYIEGVIGVIPGE